LSSSEGSAARSRKGKVLADSPLIRGLQGLLIDFLTPSFPLIRGMKKGSRGRKREKREH
jgi:hypothetical protein